MTRTAPSMKENSHAIQNHDLTAARLARLQDELTAAL